MAHDDHMSNPHFPFEEMDAIAFDLTHAAREAHIEASENVVTAIRAARQSQPIDITPTTLTIEKVTDIEVEASLATPILPADISQELLASPDVFYLDTMAALICSHMFSLELLAGGVGAASMIHPKFDIPNVAEQFRLLRTGRVWVPGKTDQTIFVPPFFSRRIALVSAEGTETYNLAVQSSHLAFNHDIWPLSDQVAD